MTAVLHYSHGVRITSINGHSPSQSARPLCADFVAKVGDAKSAAIASMY